MSARTPVARAYTLREAAEQHALLLQYRVSERQLRRAVQSGRLSYTRPGGLVILLSDEDIRQFIARSHTAARD